VRPEVPIYVVPGYGMNASYHGPRNPHVRLGAQLVAAVSREELKAICAHELGHRELYHTERAWAVLGLGYLLGVAANSWCIALWVGWVEGSLTGLVLACALAPAICLGLAECFRAWHEFEADAYAVRAFGVKLYRAAFLKIAERGPPTWQIRARLRVMDWWEASGA
jgi:Zn-dependent protease with chaperone function